MLHRNLRLIEDDTFRLGFKLQKEWAWLITTAFFLGELGAGLFLVSLFLPGRLGFFSGLVGWGIVVFGKNTAHFLYLGKPWRFWRGILRPQTSWISRGFLATFSLIIFGGLHLFLSYQGIVSPVGTVVTWIAGFAAFVVMIYDGIVMTYSPSIPLWNNPLLPILRTSYALMGGVTLVLSLSTISHFANILTHGQLSILEGLERWLIIVNLLMIIIYLLTLTYSTEAAKRSAYLIVKEKYPMVFWIGVIFIGLVVILLLPAIVITHTLGLLLFVAGCELIGDYCILFLLLRSGVYSPVNPHPSIDASLFLEA